MITREIPRAEWSTYFGRLSQIHIEEPVTIEVLEGTGAHLHVVCRPLEGINADVRDGQCTITVAAGSRPSEHLAHVISDPVRLRVLSDLYGADVVVEIESADNTTTLIHLDRAP